MPSLPAEQPKDSYFFQIFAVIAIVAIIWLGSLSGKSQNNITPETKRSPSQIFDTTAATASLPISQGAFLEPLADTVTPMRKWDVKEITLSAKSVYAIELNSGKKLIEKEPETIRPIASLAKLMTALLIIERANLNDVITVSQNAVDTYGETGGLAEGEKLSVESLLYIMLTESSNDAAVALSEKFNGQFVNDMNLKASELNLPDTFFSDPTGLDEKTKSTAKELSILMKEIIKNPLFRKITTTQEADLYSSDSKQSHHLINNNELLNKYPEIIAGKTGFTDEAGQCIILALETPNQRGIIINVILDSQDRMGEMDKLIQWEKEAFVW